MPYDNNDIMQNVPERLRSKVKGIGLPEQMPQIQQESDTSFLQDLPLPGGTSLNTVAELTSNAIDSIKETNVYKKYFYNDAEKLAEAQKISNDLKIPVNAILANDTNMEKARDIYAYKQKQQQIMPNGEKTFDMKAVYAAYPELQRLANMDETQAAIALHNIENVKQTHGIIEAFKTGWHMDSLQLERSKLGQKGYFGELTEADRKRLTEIEEEMKNAKVLPDLLEAPVESIVGNTAQQAPMMFRQFMNGQMLAIGGAVAGAAVGATGGFTVGGVTAVPGAAYGARVGYGIGARLGYAKEMYQEILGNYYLDYIGYKDRQGRQLMSDNQARAWATVSALAETGIEMANVESVIGILGSEPGTKAAANIVRDIVRRGADSASAKAQLKDWLINNARNMGVVALSESAEEGVQNAVRMGINTMAAKANPGGNIPSYSAVEMAQGAMEGAWQALPASIGFGAMAAAGSNLKYVRKVAMAANEGREYVENARKNEAGITMVDNLLNNKAANKLAKEQPEVYKNIIKNTLEGTGAENVYVDTELLLQQDGGVQILNQLAAAAGIEGQALQDVIETKADIAVPVQEYVNIDGAQELHDKLRDLISFAVGADCFARTRRIAQQMKKTYDKMIAGEMERALQNVHNLVEANFEEGPQRDMAEFILGQYEDPMEGIKEYRAERQRELDEMLEPVLATMREGMGQGVAMLKDEETGHYYRMSNNDPWYSKYYAENKKAPSQSEMKQIAEDILTGNNYYGVPGFEFRDAESMEYAEANRAQIESIRSELETLDAIEEKIGNISKGELAATEGLTPEGIRVYNRVIEALKGASSKAVRKQEAMGALLTAHHAERYAEAMRRAGYENYTAEDYLNRIRFEVNGNNAASGRFNQATTPADMAATNTVTITGNEFGRYKDINDLREKAISYYRKNLQGTTVYNSALGEIRIGKGMTQNNLRYTRRGWKEMRNTSANPIKLLSVPHLNEIISGAEYITESVPKKKKHEGEHFYYLHSALQTPNGMRYVIVSVREDKEGYLNYNNHNIETEESYNKKMEEFLSALGNGYSKPGQNPKESPSFTNSITGRAEFYKQQRVYNQPALITNKEKQLAIIEATNPMQDDYHTGIRSIDDILTAEEALGDDFGGLYPDFTEDMAQQALKTGEVTVYSSHPITAGSFVSTSKMNAQDYAGSGKIYSKKISIKDLAWIDESEGQYAPLKDYNKYANIYNQSAYHGTPHSFERFDLGAIGTGEGAQAHGWGLYFAADRKIADEYRNRLSDNVKDITIGNKKYKQLQSSGIVDENGNEPEDIEYMAAYYLGVYGNKNEALKNIEKEIENPEEYFDDYDRSVLKKAKELLKNNETEVSKSEGIVFEVDVPENDVLLDENKTLDEQPENVKNTLRKMAENQVRDMHGYYNQFADAVLIANPKEVDGRDIYRFLVNVTGNARAASIMLNENGIKGITYYGGTDGRCFVVFDDKAISIINRYNQSAGIHARTANRELLNEAQAMAEPQVQGQTAILDNGKRIIYLYENADQSTFMHEMAHIFFADMRELAEMENAPAQIKRDWQTLQDWTAWNGSQINEYIGTAVYNEFNQRDKEIRAALEEGYTYRGGERIELGTLLEEWRQERFARGFEEYLRKGKAPKESLKGVFTRFKNWLLKIYKDIKTIGAEPSKEVKAVMDRMLATQEEIDAVMQKEDIDAFRKAGGFKYLSGTSAEMWQKIYDDIHKDAYSKVIKVAMQDLTEQGQKEREQKIADERAAARERMSQEPVFIVWQYLQNNPQLDKEAAAQQIGNMTAEQYDFELNERGGSLDAAVDNYMRAYERELDAAAPDKAELARRAEEAVDTSYYKKLLTAYELEALDKSVQAEQKASRKINDTADAGAAQAINRLDRERARREGYEEEIKRLREQRGEERKQQRALRDVAVGNVDTIREYAERKISTLPVMEAANPVMWKKLSRQKARETEEAIAKNDWETARKAKKEQLVYDVMTDLATGNKKFVDKAVSTMKRRADIIRRDKNLGANDRYVYNHLLYVFGLAKRDAPIPPDYEGFVKTIVNYDQNLELTFIDTDGTVLLPDWLLNAGTATRPRDNGYIDLNVDDFKLLKDVMDNIYTAGREAKMAKAVTDRDGKKIDLDEAAAEIVTTVIDTAFKKKTADRKFGDESKIEMAARLAEEASMSLIKPETILQAMGDTAMRYIYDPMREAANTEMRMNETLRQQQADIFAAYHDGKVAKYMAQGMDEHEARAAAEKELNEMGSKKQYSIGKENITKENLLAIALNWGTDINRKRVVDGYQVSYGFIEHALRQLDAADWQFVQNIWELFETYWPDLQRVEANVTGVTLEKQPAVPFQIIGADGGVYNLNGGYYPLKYDPRKNIRTSQREADEAARVNMQGASRLGMNLGNTKERVLGHVGLSIRTDLGVIDEALTDTVHNIAMRETVRDVIRLINNNEVVQAINENWGAATWRTLNAWALDCWAAEPRTKSTYEKASQWLRTRQTQAVLGFRVSTALLNICNIGPMMAYVGPAEAVKAINSFYAHPQRQYNTIMAKSVFLRNRAETMDRDFGRLVKDNSNNAITKSAFWLITKTDLMLACPLWMHEYQKAYQDGIAKGVDPVNVEAAAVRAGDAAVRRVFGSGQTVDLAAVQRGGEFEKMFTMFYSYFSVVHNAIALKVWEARKARVDGKKLTQAMAPVLTGIIFWMAIPAVIEAGIRAMIDDDDDDLADVAKGAGITFISTAVGGIPVLRDVLPMALKAAAGEPVYNIRNNPLNETAAQMLNVTRAINSDNKDALDVAKAVLRMADMITGLPQILTDGMITAARWIDEGNLTEEDIQHYLWSILFGKNSKKN